MIPAIFVRLLIAALLYVGLILAIPAFVAILGWSLDGNWQTLLKVACGAVAVWYVLYGRPTAI